MFQGIGKVVETLERIVQALHDICDALEIHNEQTAKLVAMQSEILVPEEDSFSPVHVDRMKPLSHSDARGSQSR